MEFCMGSSSKDLYLKESYVASMVLAVVGDTIGYRNAKWQFCYDVREIYSELMEMTNGQGIYGLKLNKQGWRYSDDTAMHFATAKALLNSNQHRKKLNNSQFINAVGKQLAVQYKKSLEDQMNRSIGRTVQEALMKLAEDGGNWNRSQFNQKGWGCGGSMRAACIGLAFHKNKNLDALISASIQSGRITHHNPVGYLGSLASAFFTTQALHRVKPQIWIHNFLQQVIPRAKRYLQLSGRHVQKNLGKDFVTFVQKCKDYIQIRQMFKISQTEARKPVFPQNYGLVQRQACYKKISFQDTWPGSLGIDSILIAYDAFLGCNGNWQQLCLRAMIHGGDNDSTGTIAGAWYGAFYGFQNVVIQNYLQMEGYQQAKDLGQLLFKNFYHANVLIPSKKRTIKINNPEKKINYSLKQESCQIF